MADPPWNVDVRYASLDDCHTATGTVVVVDVLRAFTTAAHVFAAGAREIWPVAGIDEAFALRDAHRDVVLIGEDGGDMVDGFDAGNAPSQLDGVDFAGRVVVQRTSAGTQGIARAEAADARFAASFAVAGATVAALRQQRARRVTFVVTGADARRDGDEDRACAEYLAVCLRGDPPDPAPYLARVPVSTAGRAFADPGRGDRARADLELALQLDRFDLAMVVDRGARDVLRPRWGGRTAHGTTAPAGPAPRTA